MADRFSLGTGLAHDLELAFRRTAWTPEQVKELTKGDLLGRVRDVILGTAEIRARAAQPPRTTLLQPLGTVVIPATTAPFVARDAFVVTTGRRAQANITWMGDNFREWFLSKIEEPIMETTLHYAKLSKALPDAPVLKELGEFKETTLGQIFYLMSRQSNGEEGVLLIDGWANVFYVVDAYGALRAVLVRRRHGGWRVGAGPVVGPDEWGAGNRFFFRNSSVPFSV